MTEEIQQPDGDCPPVTLDAAGGMFGSAARFSLNRDAGPFRLFAARLTPGSPVDELILFSAAKTAANSWRAGYNSAVSANERNTYTHYSLRQ